MHFFAQSISESCEWLEVRLWFLPSSQVDSIFNLTIKFELDLTIFVQILEFPLLFPSVNSYCCFLLLPKFKSRSGHVIKLPVTWATHYGFRRIPRCPSPQRANNAFAPMWQTSDDKLYSKFKKFKIHLPNTELTTNLPSVLIMWHTHSQNAIGNFFFKYLIAFISHNIDNIAFFSCIP